MRDAIRLLCSGEKPRENFLDAGCDRGFWQRRPSTPGGRETQAAPGRTRPHEDLTLFSSSLPALKNGTVLAGTWTASPVLGLRPLPGTAAAGPKAPEAPQLHLVTLPQGLGNAREQDVDGGLGLLPGEVEPVGNPFGEFCFCHVSTLTTRPAPRACGAAVSSLPAPSHSSSFDHRRRPDTLRTAMATAFFWPTRTTRRLPRVTPV